VIGWRAVLAAYIGRECRPVDKYGHQPRLYALAKMVARGQGYDDDVVYAAAWLHDLGVFVGHRPEELEALARWDSVAYAMERTPAVLRETGFPVEKIAAVVEAIRTHQPGANPSTAEGVILRDADILEQLGAVGILRAVCKVGRDTRYPTFTDACAVLRRNLEELPGLLRLPAARELAERRIAILRAFLEAVDNEAQGELH
jgi:uncharacterized protein